MRQVGRDGRQGQAGSKGEYSTYLGDHHVAVESAAPVLRSRLVDVFPDLGHDGRAERDVGYEMAVPILFNLSQWCPPLAN